MALFKCNQLKNTLSMLHQLTRPLSSCRVEKSVFISQSTDVYTNLALEEWLNKNSDFKNHQVLLYYKNDPCVIIPKNENPWLNTNISENNVNENEEPISLARRQGEGATTYQDHGMMNFTFFASSESVNCDYNQNIIRRGLFRKYGIKIQQDENSLTFYNQKIMDTSSTNGTENSYQHCSLLVDVNKKDLQMTLQENKNVGKNNQKYLNVSEIEPKVTYNDILSAIGWEFMRTSPFSLKDGGRVMANQQRGFQMVNPTENWFPGITEIRNKLINWDWCYGKTPAFTTYHSFYIDSKELRVKLEIKDGKLSEIKLMIPPGLSTTGFSGEAETISTLKGKPYHDNILNSLEKIFGVKSNKYSNQKFVPEFKQQAVSI